MTDIEPELQRNEIIDVVEDNDPVGYTNPNINYANEEDIENEIIIKLNKVLDKFEKEKNNLEEKLIEKGTIMDEINEKYYQLQSYLNNNPSNKEVLYELKETEKLLKKLDVEINSINKKLNKKDDEMAEVKNTISNPSLIPKKVIEKFSSGYTKKFAKPKFIPLKKINYDMSEGEDVDVKPCRLRATNMKQKIAKKFK
jgi:uncharacterized membrane-anchored protein YhcB (DUF1043 family)